MASNRVEGKGEDSLLEALLQAEAQAREFIEKFIGSRSSLYLVIRLEEKSGEKRLIIDAGAEGVIDKDTLNDVIDEAIERAFKVFEEKAGMKSFGKS